MAQLTHLFYAPCILQPQNRSSYYHFIITIYMQTKSQSLKLPSQSLSKSVPKKSLAWPSDWRNQNSQILKDLSWIFQFLSLPSPYIWLIIPSKFTKTSVGFSLFLDFQGLMNGRSCPPNFQRLPKQVVNLCGKPPTCVDSPCRSSGQQSCHLGVAPTEQAGLETSVPRLRNPPDCWKTPVHRAVLASSLAHPTIC